MRTLLMFGLLNVAVAATSFSIVYAAIARWWKSPIGVNIMLLLGSLAAICDLGLVYNILGRPEWMLWAFAVLYFAIGGAIWWRLVILIDAQYQAPTMRVERETRDGD